MKKKPAETAIAITIKQTKALNKLQPLTCLPLRYPFWRERDTIQFIRYNTKGHIQLNACEALHLWARQNMMKMM